ncbi:Josephin family protein [Prunus dulcis]|uniref:ubiquitinyl hydrolase 1 n=1 Tax=Prunus dulcis TaxID=3755 RepID=A0A4Y1RQK0_PRUDU|nr:Josephin family protein [Prunus dulcis]
MYLISTILLREEHCDLALKQDLFGGLLTIKRRTVDKMLCLGLSVAMGLDIKQNFVVPCVYSHEFLEENVLPQGYLVSFHAIALHVRMGYFKTEGMRTSLVLVFDIALYGFKGEKHEISPEVVLQPKKYIVGSTKGFRGLGSAGHPLDSPVAEPAQIDPELENAFICHLQDHWFCIRKVSGEWYNFDSLYAAPLHLSKFYLSAYLDTLKGSGWSIFLVRGNFPKECPMSSSEASNGYGQWLSPEDAERITKSCNSTNAQPQGTNWNQQSSAPFLSTEEAELLSEMEDEDLKAAIAASLMDSSPAPAPAPSPAPAQAPSPAPAPAQAPSPSHPHPHPHPRPQPQCHPQCHPRAWPQPRPRP